MVYTHYKQSYPQSYPHYPPTNTRYVVKKRGNTRFRLWITFALQEGVFSRAPDHKMCINGCVRNAEKVIC